MVCLRNRMHGTGLENLSGGGLLHRHPLAPSPPRPPISRHLTFHNKLYMPHFPSVTDHMNSDRNRCSVCLAAVPKQHASSRNRGRGLLEGSLRPVDMSDEVLTEVVRELGGIEAVNMVQWYPGHIAKAEKELKEQLRAVDIVLEVRDGRIPMSTRHPQIPVWTSGKPRVIILNRRDMITDSDASAWSEFFAARGRHAIWSNAQKGEGIQAATAAALSVSKQMNEKRSRRGLKPRPVRAVVVGFPNVGKSALINRLLGRRVADSAPRPGVTRTLNWIRVGGDLDLLDAPGIIPMSFKDQIAAQRLAICNDIGEASYVASSVATVLLKTIASLPGGRGDDILHRVEQRYRLSMEGLTEEEFVYALGDKLFNYEPERAGQRILKDFRSLNFGKVCLDMPQAYEHYDVV